MSKKEKNVIKKEKTPKQPLVKREQTMKRDAMQQGIVAGREFEDTFMLDMVTIFCREYFHLGKYKVADAFNAFQELVISWKDEAWEDKTDNGDDSRAVYKHKLDECIRQCVPEEYYVPYEKRYTIDLYADEFLPEKVREHDKN